MKTFKDCAGREWDLSITIGSIQRVRDLAGVNLDDLGGGDPPLLVRRDYTCLLLGETHCSVT